MLPNDYFRYAVFESNLAKIREHNSRPGETWRMAVTQFADMTEAEFRSEVVGRGYIRTPAPASAPAPALGSAPRELPEQVDWREAGAVSDTKNQGACGSCWAFATVEQVESYAAINNVTLMPSIKLSTQQVGSVFT